MELDLTKEMARLAKLEAKKAYLLDPSKKPMVAGGIKTAITEAERIQRKQENVRKNFVKDVLAAKDEVLKDEVEDYTRIMDLIPITEKGIVEAEEVLATYDIEMAKLEAAIYLLKKKKEAAENDVDLLRDALESLAEFNEAVKEYALTCIEASEEFDEDEIIDLWERMMPERYIDALNRGTTSFGSLDYLFGSTQGEFNIDPATAMQSLQMKVDTLFHKYQIIGPVEPDMEGI